LQVSGFLLTFVKTEYGIQSLDHNVIFLKQTDVVLTDDTWRVAINLDTGTYEEIISTVKTDLHLIETQRKEFTFMPELKQIEALLGTLESKLQNFYHVLPKPNRRRALLGLGGIVLQHLFGVATNKDAHLLHDTFDILQSQNSDITHSVNDQLTYIKKLDTLAKINTAAISNLSDTVKDVVIQSHDRFQQITRDIVMLNVTLYGQREYYMVIRMLELALLQVNFQIDELFAALQIMTQGKLPLSLITPATLHNILRNVSLHLPEGYQLIAGTQLQNIYIMT
jgi:hypothetical protein